MTVSRWRRHDLRRRDRVEAVDRDRRLRLVPATVAAIVDLGDRDTRRKNTVRRGVPRKPCAANGWIGWLRPSCGI
jgi:hypothetical protein